MLKHVTKNLDTLLKDCKMNATIGIYVPLHKILWARQIRKQKF